MRPSVIILLIELAVLVAAREPWQHVDGYFIRKAKLLITERIVGGPNDGLKTKTSDLNMLVPPDGQELTADEFAALLGNEGFRMERIIEVTPRLSFVEAAPIYLPLRYSHDLKGTRQDMPAGERLAPIGDWRRRGTA